jgi:hypothetical protein
VANRWHAGNESNLSVNRFWANLPAPTWWKTVRKFPRPSHARTMQDFFGHVPYSPSPVHLPGSLKLLRGPAQDQSTRWMGTRALNAIPEAGARTKSEGWWAPRRIIPMTVAGDVPRLRGFRTLTAFLSDGRYPRCRADLTPPGSSRLHPDLMTRSRIKIALELGEACHDLAQRIAAGGAEIEAGRAPGRPSSAGRRASAPGRRSIAPSG